MSKIIGNNQKTSLLSTFQIGQKKKVHAANKQELSIFNAIDANNDGIISKNEMKGIVKGKVKGSNGKFIEKDFIKLKDLPNRRSLVVDEQGRQWVMSHDGFLLNQEYVKDPTKFKETQTYNRNVNIRKNAENLAKNFYQIADDNSGLQSMRKMQNLLDKNINANNIVAFLDSYAKENIRKGDSSIIDTVTSETGAGGSIQQKKVLMTIMNKLCAAAQKAGVSAGDIQKAKKDFETSLDKEFSAALRRTNPKDMEKALDFLRGAIVAKENIGGEMTDAEAVNILKKDAVRTHNGAVKSYREARNEEGWAASVGDTVCGWFGCTTIDDMDKKLGKNAAAVRGMAQAKTVAEFKTKYKEAFGFEFDKNKIAARDKALGNYQQANALSSTIKLTNEILKNSGNKDYNSLRNEIKTKFKLDDETVDTIIKNYGLTNNKNINSDTDRKAMLVKFLQETQSNSADTYRGLTKGKTLEQMGKDLDLLNKSAFGTTDIVKDVVDFNQNMVVTEMVTEGAFEVAGTVALQFVPGLGQMAAARLAVSAAKWGTKAVKIANAAAKAEKAFATVSKVQQGAGFTSKVAAKSAQIGSQMAAAGAATAVVDLSNGDETKAVMKKTLMNMSFAGVGAGASQLAPKIMKSFGIADKALANEIAEEIINAAGSLGISKLAGDEYGSTDAFVDIATGIVMARISHIKGGKPDVNATTAAKPHSQNNGIDIPTQKADIPDAAPVHSSTNTPTETNINTTAKPANKQSIIEKYANNPELISNLSNQEKIALKSDIDNILGKAYAGKLDNPETTLQNLEAVLKQLGDNETINVLNDIRKKFNIGTSHPDIDINTPKIDISTDIKSRLESANSREDFTALRDEIKKMPNNQEKQALIAEYVKAERNWRMNSERPDIRMQYNPEAANAAPAQTSNSATNIETSTAPEVKQSIMGTVKGSDNILKTANLDDDAIQNQLLAMLEKEIPSTRRVPGRVKTLKEIQALVNSPSYAQLDDTGKELAKLAIITSNPRIDNIALFDDLNISVATKRKLKNIESCLDVNAPIETAAALYHKEDIEIISEIARAKGIDETHITKLQETFNKAQANGSLLIHTTEIETENIPIRQIVKDGKTYNMRVIDCSDPATFANPELYGLPAGTTADNMRLTVHMNDGINTNPGPTVGKMRQSDALNLSASITDGKNTLYDNQQVGILLDYDMGAVSYASNYAAGTGFCKTNVDFAKAKLSLNEPSTGTFIRERFVQNLKDQGFDISTEDYMAFSAKIQDKKNVLKELQNLAQNGQLNINGKQIPLDIAEKALLHSTDNLMNVSYEMRGLKVDNGFNEVNIYNPEIKAIYVRSNTADGTIESILTPNLLEYAQRRNLPIIFQRNVIKTN